MGMGGVTCPWKRRIGSGGGGRSPYIHGRTPADDNAGQLQQPITGLKSMLHRLLTCLAALPFCLALNATHVVGGEIYYDHLGGDQYQVTLKLYRDCDPNTNVNGTGYDAYATIGVFSGDGTFLYFQQSLTFPGAQTVPVIL